MSFRVQLRWGMKWEYRPQPHVIAAEAGASVTQLRWAKLWCYKTGTHGKALGVLCFFAKSCLDTASATHWQIMSRTWLPAH